MTKYAPGLYRMKRDYSHYFLVVVHKSIIVFMDGRVNPPDFTRHPEIWMDVPEYLRNAIIVRVA